MILEIDQKIGQIDISYLNKDGNKAVMQIPVPSYSQWQIDYEGMGTPGYIDFSGKPVKKKWAKSFRTFDILEFLKSLPKEQQEELFAYRESNLVACDIETMIGDRFPKPELAEQPVNAISCVDSQMNILVYTTKNCAGEITVNDRIEAEPNEIGAYQEIIKIKVSDIYEHDPDNADAAVERLQNEGLEMDSMIDWPTGKWYKVVPRVTTMKDEVDKIVHEQIGHLIAPHEKIDVNLLQFDTEKHMLEAWFGNVSKFASVIAFWNGDGFDKPYLLNRCKILGIPVNIGSITGEIASQMGTPKHTVFVDYMYMVEKYGRTIPNRESMKLDYISWRVLGVGKMPYRGTLKELEENDVPGFLAYNAIDSCIVQLIHRQMNLMSVFYGFAQVCKLPLAKADSQVAQTESLISLDTLDMLDLAGIEMPEKPNTGATLVAAFDPRALPRRKYDGGHVKDPFQHVASWSACIDFSGLYPSVHRSCNLSIENYLGPIGQFNSAMQKKILDDPNYFVSCRNNVYKNDRPYAYKRIQIYLRAKRDYHKKRSHKHLSIQQPFIEYALWERGVWKEKPNTDPNIKELIYPVWIDGKEYRPNLCNLNEKDENGEYKDHVNFLWFLFHNNLREGFFEFNMQLSFKLVANSLYGATANEWNTFRNVEVADDTTAEGRNSIICAEKIMNNWLNYEWPTDYEAHKWFLERFPGQFTKLVEGDMPPLEIKDRVYYIDTDSLYVGFKDLMDNCGYTGDEIDFFQYFYTEFFGKIMNKRLHDMVNGRHGESMQAFDLEHITQSALFRKKKSYMYSHDWDDGRRYSYDDAFNHLKCTGFALARSFQSLKCREVAKNAIVQIMQGKWATKEDYLRNMLVLWQDFQTWSIEDISKRMSIKKDLYEKQILAIEPYPDFAKRTLPQYKGAAWYNWQLRKRGLTAAEQDIDDGYVCFYEDVNGNHFAYRLFELPDWHPEPNKVVQFWKLLAGVIRDVAIYYDIVCPLPLGEVEVGVESESDEDED